MSPLFGNKAAKQEDKAAKEAEGAAEVERLTALPVTELAVELMRAFGPDGPQAKDRQGTAPMQVIQWLMAPYPYHPSLRTLSTAVVEGLQALERAGLLTMRISGDSGSQRFSLTRLGAEALAQGSAGEYLAPSSGT